MSSGILPTLAPESVLDEELDPPSQALTDPPTPAAALRPVLLGPLPPPGPLPSAVLPGVPVAGPPKSRVLAPPDALTGPLPAVHSRALSPRREGGTEAASRLESESVAGDGKSPVGHGESPAPEIPGYSIRGPLGRGGMAEVWLADRRTATGIDIPCVVKRILPAYAEDKAFRERFLDEARIVSYLRHPNIVSVTDVGYAGTTLFLVMEWVEGADLSRLLQRVRARGGEFPLRHALFVMQQTLAGLHHAHTAVGPDGAPLQVVHRDLSPGNVVISRQGAVKIADFGVARGSVTKREERRGTLAGKVQYFAPELFRGSGASPRTDVFAMGVVLYEMLTLKPFMDRRLHMLQVREQILRFDPKRLVEQDLTIPDGLESILTTALATDSAQRYPSALAFLEDINDFAYESGLRLLDAHFAPYVVRVLDEPPPTNRRPIRARTTPSERPA